MKLMLVISFASLSALADFAVPVAQIELEQCLEVCTAETEPGWEMRACVSSCVEDYAGVQERGFNKCETYEDDCERDDGRDGVGPDGPIDDGEDDRDGDDWDSWDGI